MNVRFLTTLLLISTLRPLTATAADEAATPPASPPPTTQPEPDREKLEQQFVELMSGATLVGSFTMGDKPPTQERYTITKVTKLKGDYYLFAARIQYGERDMTVPLVLPVKWAGDTPVITVTNFGIPGMGTYTARVMIYDQQYAGTWRGANVGGQMWGKIERGEPAGDTSKAAGEPPVPTPAKRE